MTDILDLAAGNTETTARRIRTTDESGLGIPDNATDFPVDWFHKLPSYLVAHCRPFTQRAVYFRYVGTPNILVWVGQPERTDVEIMWDDDDGFLYDSVPHLDNGDPDTDGIEKVLTILLDKYDNGELND